MLAKGLSGAAVGHDGAVIKVDRGIAAGRLSRLLVVGLLEAVVQEAHRQGTAGAYGESGLAHAANHSEPGTGRSTPEHLVAIRRA